MVPVLGRAEIPHHPWGFRNDLEFKAGIHKTRSKKMTWTQARVGKLLWLYSARSPLAFLGGSWHSLLCGSLCLHHVRRLWPFLWGCVHALPRCGDHSRRSPAFYYWPNWLLCYNPGEPLWARHGKLTLRSPHDRPWGYFIWSSFLNWGRSPVDVDALALKATPEWTHASDF